MRAGIDYVGVSTPFYCNDGWGNFVLHRRSKNCRDEQGTWDPGSGQLEYGLSLEENVLKEVAEEYGCTGIIQEQLPPHGIFRDLHGTRSHWLAVPFFIKVRPQDVRINDPDKMDEIGWFTLDSLPKPLHTGFQYTFEKYKEYFDKYKNTKAVCF